MAVEFSAKSLRLRLLRSASSFGLTNALIKTVGQTEFLCAGVCVGLNRVLVVDDDQESRNLLSEVLVANGYSVEVAEDGASLWKALSMDEGRAVILIDLRMPGENGLELLRKLQEKKIACDAILMSSFITVAERDLAQELGVGAFLEKPFRLSELLDVVSEVAGKHPIGISSYEGQDQGKEPGPVGKEHI